MSFHIINLAEFQSKERIIMEVKLLTGDPVMLVYERPAHSQVVHSFGVVTKSGQCVVCQAGHCSHLNMVDSRWIQRSLVRTLVSALLFNL